MLVLFASGLLKVMTPTLTVEFQPPPRFDVWVGGSSRVVPLTVTVHGAVAGVPVAAQVLASFTTTPRTSTEESWRNSAVPAGGVGPVVILIIRNRSRVTGAPVVLRIRSRNDTVPKTPLVTGVKSRTRF